MSARQLRKNRRALLRRIRAIDRHTPPKLFRGALAAVIVARFPEIDRRYNCAKLDCGVHRRVYRLPFGLVLKELRTDGGHWGWKGLSPNKRELNATHDYRGDLPHIFYMTRGGALISQAAVTEDDHRTTPEQQKLEDTRLKEWNGTGEFHDLHRGNIGWIRGSLVIIDAGFYPDCV